MGFFNKKYSLNDLDNIKEQIKTKRNDYKIIVIENTDFDYIEKLRSHDFNVVLYEDIRDLSVISEFDIIVSDIKYLVKHTDSKQEDANLIQEIYKKYPNKYIISHSMVRYDPAYNNYFILCDLSLKKGLDLNEWVNVFDKAIDKVNDPIYQWKKTKTNFMKNKINLATASKLEKMYIKSILKKKPDIFLKETRKVDVKSETSKIILESINTFVLTLISKIIKPN